MALTLTLTGKTPGQTQFGLDTFTEHYKCGATADDVLTDPSVPQKGDAHPDYPFMFVTDRYCSETGESASALDLVYTGALKEDDDGNPVLPPSQATFEDSVMSASSSKAATGVELTSPISVQFYAPTSNLSWITYNAKGASSDVSDPTGDIGVITLTLADNTFTGTSFNVAALIAAFFSIEIIGTVRSQELVQGGKYWLNTAKKIKHFVPYITDLSPGFYPVPFASGHDYVAGDTISISSGGTCIMTVTATFNGQIMGTTIVSNTMSVASSTPIAATGGSGTGASYTVIELT